MRSVDTCGACRRVRGLLFIVALCSVVGVPGSAVWADLQNGDFSNGLNGWDFDFTPGDGIDPPVWVENEEAVLGEGAGFVVNGFQEFAYIEQAFIVPAGTVSLSFEYSPRFSAGDQTFSAYLTYPDYSPLVPGAGDPFFQHDTSLGLAYNSAFVDWIEDFRPDWNRVTLDLSGLTFPADGLLAFGLFGEEVGGSGEVRLDNVCTVVPAPAAVVLSVLGMGTAGTMLRRRTHQRS